MLFGNFFESIFPQSQSEMLKLLRGDRDLGPSDPLQPILDFEPRPDRKAGELKAPSLVGVSGSGRILPRRPLRRPRGR